MTTLQEIGLTIGGTSKRSRFTPKAVVITFDNLPNAAQDFIVRYGLKQYLSDGVAGAETQEAFDAGIAERMEKLAKADFTRTRGESSPTDNVETLAKRLIRDAIKVKAKAAGKTYPKDAITAAVEKVWADDDKQAAWRAEAEKEIAKRQAAAAGVDLDDLMPEEPEGEEGADEE